MGSVGACAIVEIPFTFWSALIPGNALALAAGLIPELFVAISQITFFTFAQLAFATFKVPDCRIIVNTVISERCCIAV